MRNVHAVLFLTATSLLSVVAPAFGQGTPPLGSVTKLGIDIDLRSGGRVVFDETTAGSVILPESGTPPSTVLPTVPQVQLRGANLDCAHCRWRNTTAVRYTGLGQKPRNVYKRPRSLSERTSEPVGRLKRSLDRRQYLHTKDCSVRNAFLFDAKLQVRLRSTHCGRRT